MIPARAGAAGAGPALAMLACAAVVGGCGVTTAGLPEPWERAIDPDATYHMEIQVKHAIFCELKRAVAEARQRTAPRRLYGPNRRDITTVENRFLPDSWGILVQLSLQVDERSAIGPTVIAKTPVDDALTGFRIGSATAAQGFSVGVGGNLTVENQRNDKFNAFYAIRDLAIPNSVTSGCVQNSPDILGPRTTGSSPFIDATGLGIREWLGSAVRVIAYHPSSRAADDDSGPSLGPTAGDAAADTATYSNKFIITTGASVSPTWNLLRIGTGTSPLLDLSRVRTHELIMTVGAGALPPSKAPLGKAVIVGPSSGVVAAQLASQIGSAVANALQR